MATAYAVLAVSSFEIFQILVPLRNRLSPVTRPGALGKSGKAVFHFRQAGIALWLSPF